MVYDDSTGTGTVGVCLPRLARSCLARTLKPPPLKQVGGGGKRIQVDYRVQRVPLLAVMFIQKSIAACVRLPEAS